MSTVVLLRKTFAAGLHIFLAFSISGYLKYNCHMEIGDFKKYVSLKESLPRKDREPLAYKLEAAKLCKGA